MLVKTMVAMEIHLKITRLVEEFLKNRTYRVKLGGHLSSEGIAKSGVPQGSVLELTCKHLFIADDVKLIAP